MARHLVWTALTVGMSLGNLVPADGEDWPRFRGPNGTGVSTSAGAPTECGPDRNVVWKTDSGAGTSSPIVAGGRLYYTSFEADSRFVNCLDAQTGAVLWRGAVQKLREENASRPNGPATCTPATDGTHVVAVFPDAGLVCYSRDGAEVWRVDVGPFHSMHGIATSPIIAAGQVVFVADQLRGSFLAAYDVGTGSLAWKVDRTDGLTGAYSTPSVLRLPDGSEQIVVSGPQEVIGYDAKTGSVAWSLPGLTNAPVSVPVIAGDRLFVCEPVGEAEPISMLSSLDANQDGKYSLEEVKRSVPMFRLLERMDREYGNGDGVVEASEWDQAFGGFVGKGGLVAIGLDYSAQETKARVQWKYEKTVPYVSSPLLYENVLYVVQDGGIVTSFDARSGEVRKRDRLKQGGKQFYASPVAADGKIWIVDTEGRMTVLRAGAEWDVLATNELGAACFATPAICGGRVYVRADRTLYCFGK